MLLSFAAFLILFLALGLYASLRGKTSHQDYYLAGQSISPWAVGLSGVATNNSGYMFIGMVGYTYAVGLAAIWVGIGLIVGDFLTSLVVHRRFRQATEDTQAVSYAGVLSAWHGTRYKKLQFLIGLISLIFLLAYAGAQLSASNKLFQVIVDESWPTNSGALIAAFAITLYCLRGGIRASIWTDVAQAGLMLITAFLLFGVLLYSSGGYDGALNSLQSIPGFLNLTNNDVMLPGVLGGILFAIGWIFCGVSVIGQPHIMSRFMTLNKPENYYLVRPWYYSFYILMYILVVGIGLFARIHFPELGAQDPELAMPTVAHSLFPPVITGILIAGVFAAAMSTADSQIISCSSVLSRDLGLHWGKRTWEIPAATLASITIALLFALSNNQSIFSLVILAWSAMGAAFAPLLLIIVCKGRPTELQAITVVLTGLTVSILWHVVGWHRVVYEGMPAILLALLVYFLWTGARKSRLSGLISILRI